MSRQKTCAGRRWGRALRALLFLLAGTLASTAVHADVPVGRSWAATVPTIDGNVPDGEWDAAQVTTLAHGRLATMNDGRSLYVLLDVTSDTGDDPVASSAWEFFTLAFDADLNHAVTPRVDLAYASCPDGRVFVKTYYLGGGTLTGCQDPSPASAGAVGFGRSPVLLTPHRIWEFRLDFAEIGVDPATWAGSGTMPHVRMNVGLASVTPPFVQAEPDPSLYPDLGNTFRVDLATTPPYPPGSAGYTFAGVGLVPASFIDTAGYATLAVDGYSYRVTDAPFGGTLNVFGNWADLYARGARSYRVLHTPGGGTSAPLLHTWTNMLFTGGTWAPRAIGPDAAGRYPVPPPSENWYLTNLLVAWPTTTVAEGPYTLRLELFDGSGSPLPDPTDNSLTLRVINTPPVAQIHHLSYGGTDVGECAIVYEGTTPADFTFEVTAYDPNGALAGWSLIAEYGDNRPAIAIASDGYAAHIDDDGLNLWRGFRTTWLTRLWRPPTPCSYSIRLSAGSRSQNGYGVAVPSALYTKTMTYLAGTEPAPCKK